MLRSKEKPSIITENYRKEDIKSKISADAYTAIETVIKEYVKDKTGLIYADRIPDGKWDDSAFKTLIKSFNSEAGMYFGNIVFETLMNDKSALWEVYKDNIQRCLVYKLIPGRIKSIGEIENCFEESGNACIKENMKLSQFVKSFIGNAQCMNEVIINNEAGIPPVKTFYDKYMAANTEKTDYTEHQAIGKLFGHIFKEILGYEMIKEDCPVEDSNIKTAALYGKKENAVVAVF